MTDSDEIDAKELLFNYLQLKRGTQDKENLPTVIKTQPPLRILRSFFQNENGTRKKSYKYYCDSIYETTSIQRRRKKLSDNIPKLNYKADPSATKMKKKKRNCLKNNSYSTAVPTQYDIKQFTLKIPIIRLQCITSHIQKYDQNGPETQPMAPNDVFKTPINTTSLSNLPPLQNSCSNKRSSQCSKENNRRNYRVQIYDFNKSKSKLNNSMNNDIALREVNYDNFSQNTFGCKTIRNCYPDAIEDGAKQSSKSEVRLKRKSAIRSMNGWREIFNIC